MDYLEQFHASLGDVFTGVPKMPKDQALLRPAQLQEELDALDAGNVENETFIATLTREIAEAQAVVDAADYTEDDAEIAYYHSYNLALKTWVDQN
jgi:hypothetical protein